MQRKVCAVAELPPGSMAGFTVGTIPVVIVRTVSGAFRGVVGRCPHQGGPLCLGVLTGTTLPSAPGEYVYGRENEIIRCPWHGFEYDSVTGRCLGDPERMRVRTLDVVARDGDVLVDL